VSAAVSYAQATARRNQRPCRVYGLIVPIDCRISEHSAVGIGRLASETRTQLGFELLDLRLTGFRIGGLDVDTHKTPSLTRQHDQISVSPASDNVDPPSTFRLPVRCARHT